MSFKEAIEQAEKKAAENIKAENNDYIGDDGLLYCGKCHTRKQGEYNFPWGVVRPYHLCKCAEEQKKKEAAEWEKSQRMIRERDRLSELRNAGLLESSIAEICRMTCPEAKKEVERLCFPDKNLRSWTFENDDMKNPAITNAAKRYVEIFPEMRAQGQGLLFFGEVGRGKTYAAVEIANALLDKGYSVLVTNFARIVNTVSGMFEGKQAYYDSLNEFDLLVIDDLAAERKTEYVQEIVLNVIENRYRAGLPMIITTNLTAQELKNPQEINNKRLFDRVLEKCLPIEVLGVNRRHQKTAYVVPELKKKLGMI